MATKSTAEITISPSANSIDERQVTVSGGLTPEQREALDVAMWDAQYDRQFGGSYYLPARSVDRVTLDLARAGFAIYHQPIGGARRLVG